MSGGRGYRCNSSPNAREWMFHGLDNLATCNSSSVLQQFAVPYLFSVVSITSHYLDLLQVQRLIPKWQ